MLDSPMWSKYGSRTCADFIATFALTHGLKGFLFFFLPAQGNT